MPKDSSTLSCAAAHHEVARCASRPVHGGVLLDEQARHSPRFDGPDSGRRRAGEERMDDDFGPWDD